MASRLPIEVVAHVMSFLGVSDRKEAALVCRAWYEASLDPALQRNIIVNFAYEKTEEILESFRRRRLSHLVLSHFDNSSITKNAILRACELGSDDLKSLSLKDSNITEGTLAQLLSKCSQLECLDLSGCNALFMAGTLLNSNAQVRDLREKMKHVKELNLSSLRFLSDCSFNRVVAVFPNLKRLILASTPITYNGNAYYPSDAATFENSAVFTFRCLERYLLDNIDHVKGLNLSRTAMTNQHLGHLVRVKNLQLEELVLVGCRDVGNEGISQLGQHQPNLKHLDISGCVDVSDAGLACIANHLNKLEILRVNKCRLLTDSSIALLKNLDTLHMLDMSECYEVTSKGLLKSVCDVTKTCLTHLNLACCSKVDTAFVVELVDCVPLLQHLDLGSCFLLQDFGLHKISRTLHCLRHLRLAWCKAITNLGLLGIQADGICPVHDPIADVIGGECSCTRKSNAPVIFRKPTAAIREKNEATLKRIISEQELTVIPENIGALTSLRNLDLSSCLQLTDIGLRGSIKFCELKVLKMNCLHGLTDAGLIDIANNNPGLEELQLQQCARLTDLAIDVVTSRCQRLTHLDISNCDRLTDTALIHIGDNCKRLRHLDVSFCCGISPQAVDLLEKRLRSLSYVLSRNVGVSSFPLLSEQPSTSAT